MRVAYALLAEAAMLTPDKRLSVLGAGVFALAFPALPAAMARLDLALKLEFSSEDIGRRFTLHVDVVGPDGTSLGEAEEGIQSLEATGWPEDWPAVIADVLPSIDVVVHFPRVGFPATGRYNFRIMVDGQLLHQVPLLILRTPSPTPSGSAE